jgi:hypothetical protein
LRAAYGLRAGLPLGVPTTADVPATLSHWLAMQAGSAARGPRVVITSLSVPSDELTDIAHEIGEPWVGPTFLLRATQRPARISTESAVFQRGSCMAPVRAESDAEQLPQVAIALRGAGLVSQFRIDGRRLPIIRALEKSLAAPPQGYRHGGYETWANSGDELPMCAGRLDGRYSGPPPASTASISDGALPGARQRA